MAQYCLPQLPSKERLRACLNCSLLKTYQQLYDEGCDNCEAFLKFKNNPERIVIFSSLNFEGIVGITAENRTWTANLMQLEKFCPGVYAIHVFGWIPAPFLQQGMEYLGGFIYPIFIVD